MMKKIVMIATVVFCSVALFAQRGVVSLNLDAGYTFQDQINFDLGHAVVEAGFQYGGGLEFFVSDNKSFDIKYLRMDTHIPAYLTNSNTPVNVDSDKASVNYVLFGGNTYFGQDPDAKARPYGGLGLGLGIIGLDGTNTTRFAWDAKLGVKIQTQKAVSLKLQAYMQSIVGTAGSDVWYGYWGAYAVPDYVALWQFGFSGILCFDFRK
jgi:opacity protein-like surface antigen